MIDRAPSGRVGEGSAPKGFWRSGEPLPTTDDVTSNRVYHLHFFNRSLRGRWIRWYIFRCSFLPDRDEATQGTRGGGDDASKHSALICQRIGPSEKMATIGRWWSGVAP